MSRKEIYQSYVQPEREQLLQELHEEIKAMNIERLKSVEEWAEAMKPLAEALALLGANAENALASHESQLVQAQKTLEGLVQGAQETTDQMGGVLKKLKKGSRRKWGTLLVTWILAALATAGYFHWQGIPRYEKLSQRAKLGEELDQYLRDSLYPNLKEERKKEIDQVYLDLGLDPIRSQ